MVSAERRAYWRRKYHERRARAGKGPGPSGRPPKLTAAQVDMLLYEVRYHPNRPLAEIGQTYGVSEATVRRYAHRAGMRRRVVARPSGGTRRPPPSLPWYEAGLSTVE